MKRNKLKLPTKAKPTSTDQQGQDFTAEGAPPPGKVGSNPPVDAAEQARMDAEKARRARAAGH